MGRRSLSRRFGCLALWRGEITAGTQETMSESEAAHDPRRGVTSVKPPVHSLAHDRADDDTGSPNRQRKNLSAGLLNGTAACMTPPSRSLPRRRRSSFHTSGNSSNSRRAWSLLRPVKKRRWTRFCRIRSGRSLSAAALAKGGKKKIAKRTSLPRAEQHRNVQIARPIEPTTGSDQSLLASLGTSLVAGAAVFAGVLGVAIAGLTGAAASGIGASSGSFRGAQPRLNQ